MATQVNHNLLGEGGQHNFIQTCGFSERTGGGVAKNRKLMVSDEELLGETLRPSYQLHE